MKATAHNGSIGVLAVLIFVMAIIPAASQALDVKGIIEEDTTWAVSDSPVNIVGDVLVAQDTVLTVEPGVRVEFQALENASRGFLFNVEGTLFAKGTRLQPIYFTAQDRSKPWAAIVFRDVSQDWNGTTATGCILAFCVVEYGDSMIVTENAMPRIANNVVRFGSSVGIAASAVEGAVSASGQLTIEYNQIYENPTGLVFSAEGGQIRENYFLNNEFSVAIIAQTNNVDFSNNTIISSSGDLSGAGVYVSMEEPVSGSGRADIQIEENVIQSDNAGASLVAITVEEDSRYTLDLSKNNLVFTDEARYAVYLFDWPDGSGSATLALPDNWWGTEEMEAIDGLIYDQNDDYRLPTVDYEPFATQAFDEAGSRSGYPAVADAGPDQEAQVDTLVTLDGSNSYDPDEIGVYLWKQVEGPDVNLQDSDDAIASFIAPPGGTEGQELRFTLTVSTDAGFPHSDEVVVSILPDEPVPVVEVGGGCFLQSAGTPTKGHTRDNVMKIVSGFLIAAAGLVFLYRRKKVLATTAALVMLVCLASSAQAGFLAVGGGGGGDADQYNITLETGAKDIILGGQTLMFAFGIPFIPHGDKNLPENTIATPCPNDQCVALEDERKGTEVGFYGKLGIELGSSRVFANAIGGFTVYTESQLARSEGSGAVYEQSSDTTIEPLYGIGLSYFPENWAWPVLMQVDFDVTRGVTGTIGWHW